MRSGWGVKLAGGMRRDPREREAFGCDQGRECLGFHSRGAPHPRPPGAGSCGRALGAPALGPPPQTSAASIRSSPRRQTRGSGCPGGQSKRTRKTPETRTLITRVEALQLRALRHQPQPRTKPHPPMEDLYPTAGPAPSVAPSLGIWPRLTHHVPLSLQTGQVPAARAQVRGGRVNVTGGVRQAGSRRRFRLGDGLRLRSPAASGRLYRADRCADRRAALQGRGLVDGRRATLQLLLRGPVSGGQTEAGSPQGPRQGKNSGLKTETLVQKGRI